MPPGAVGVILGVAVIYGAYVGGKKVVHVASKPVMAVVHVFHKPKPPAPVPPAETK